MRRFQYRMRETDGVGIWQKASNMLMAKHLLRQCWETVRGHAFSPLEIAENQLKDGKISDAYHTLFAEYCKFATGPASPMLLTALMYILHYHVWHWRDLGMLENEHAFNCGKNTISFSVICRHRARLVSVLDGYNQLDCRTPGRNEDLRREVRKNFKDLLEIHLERGVEPMAIMAYIHMRDGNRMQAKRLLEDAVC